MFRKVSVVLVLLGAALSGCQGQGPAAAHQGTQGSSSSQPQGTSTGTMSEADFRKGMAIDDIQHVQYHDTDGQELTFSQFIAVVQAGRSFSKTVNPGKSLAVLTINKKDESGLSSSAGSDQLSFKVGDELPAIELRDLHGNLNVLANGKKYTLLSFFFDGCVPCIQEIPALNALAGESANTKIISVTFDSSEVAEKFASQRGLKTSIVPNAQGYIDAIGVKVYPTLLLVSPEGRLVGVRSSYEVPSGQQSAVENLKAWIASLGLKT